MNASTANNLIFYYPFADPIILASSVQNRQVRPRPNLPYLTTDVHRRFKGCTT